MAVLPHALGFHLNHRQYAANPNPHAALCILSAVGMVPPQSSRKRKRGTPSQAYRARSTLPCEIYQKASGCGMTSQPTSVALTAYEKLTRTTSVGGCLR